GGHARRRRSGRAADPTRRPGRAACGPRRGAGPVTADARPPEAGYGRASHPRLSKNVAMRSRTWPAAGRTLRRALLAAAALLWLAVSVRALQTPEAFDVLIK